MDSSSENWRLNERHYGALQGLDKKKQQKNTVTNKFISGVVLMIFLLQI